MHLKSRVLVLLFSLVALLGVSSCGGSTQEPVSVSTVTILTEATATPIDIAAVVATAPAPSDSTASSPTTEVPVPGNTPTSRLDVEPPALTRKAEAALYSPTTEPTKAPTQASRPKPRPQLPPTETPTITVVPSPLPTSSDPDVKQGFPVKIPNGTHPGIPVYALVGNIDSDPSLEMMLSTGIGYIRAWKANGSPIPGWSVTSERNGSFPALGDLSPRFPGSEILTQEFNPPASQTFITGLRAYSGSGATLPGWPQKAGSEFAPPRLADIDGDGLDEIIARYSGIAVYKADGSPIQGWPIEGEGFAVGDVNGDGRDGRFEIATTYGQFQVYHPDGTYLPGFPAPMPSGRDAFGSPVIGDVDGDGKSEIIYTTLVRNEFIQSETNPSVWGSRKFIEILSSNGVLKNSIPLGVEVQPELVMPGLSNLDCDGSAEIVVITGNTLHVFKSDGVEFPGWPQTMKEDGRFGSIVPAVGDVDGDGRPDIVAIIRTASTDPDGRPREYLLAYDRNGKLLPHFPKEGKFGSGSIPTISDIDNDGRNEIIVPTIQTYIFQDKTELLWVFDLHGPPAHGQIQWGQFGGGPQHQNSYKPDSGKCVR